MLLLTSPWLVTGSHFLLTKLCFLPVLLISRYLNFQFKLYLYLHFQQFWLFKICICYNFWIKYLFLQALFQANPCKHPIVFLKDVKGQDMEALVEFIYKGEVRLVCYLINDYRYIFSCFNTILFCNFLNCLNKRFK